MNTQDAENNYIHQSDIEVEVYTSKEGCIRVLENSTEKKVKGEYLPIYYVQFKSFDNLRWSNIVEYRRYNMFISFRKHDIHPKIHPKIFTRQQAMKQFDMMLKALQNGTKIVCK